MRPHDRRHGTGKTIFALPLIHAVLRQYPSDRSLAFGVLDAKGELFERALFLVACRLNELDGPARQELLRRLVIIDFANREARAVMKLGRRSAGCRVVPDARAWAFSLLDLR